MTKVLSLAAVSQTQRERSERGLKLLPNVIPSLVQTGYMHCDLLQVYSDLCVSMPEMKQCASWQTMCSVIPDWPLCPSGQSEVYIYYHTHTHTQTL